MRTVPLIFAAAGAAAIALEAKTARRKPSLTAMLVVGAVGYGVGTLFDKPSDSTVRMQGTPRARVANVAAAAETAGITEEGPLLPVPPGLRV